MSSQPTAARLTPAGRGAVATIRFQDNSRWNATSCSPIDRFFQAANGMPLQNQPIGKIAFGQWGLSDTEELVVCRVATEITEIHCHGGDAAVERILQDLKTVGCAIVDWRDQLAEHTDLLEAEGLEALSRTSTWRTTQIVLEQTNGLLRNAYTKLLQLEASDREGRNRHLDALLDWSSLGLHLTTPWNVVLTGRPNVGKSSLINALLGYQRAIVYDEPGTTRDIVTGETAFDGWPVTLADTAGMRNAIGEIEAAGIEMARQHLAQADLQIVLIDLSQKPTSDDIRILTTWPTALIVAHKADLPSRWGDQLPKNSLPVSSVTGQGLAEFQHELVQRLVPNTPPCGTPIPITARQVDHLRDARARNSVDDQLNSIKRLFGDTSKACARPE
ncbi:GTPase [Schlesneria paludicola]|uniref:GTPase n=1 Tax=Schlesneria paludicola TaxID=360056 RepID=UPI00029A6B8A|nr:GTPase [Schlesneria paludicola]